MLSSMKSNPNLFLCFRPMNGYIPSYFSSFSQPNLFGRLGNGTTGQGQLATTPKGSNQVTSTHMGGHGHRRLPATPNKPSTLFTQTASSLQNTLGFQVKTFLRIPAMNSNATKYHYIYLPYEIWYWHWVVHLFQRLSNKYRTPLVSSPTYYWAIKFFRGFTNREGALIGW